MDIHHRKVDLQSPQDLTYLLDNIKKAAQEKLDLHIPPSAAPKGEEDAFRTKVEHYVQQYISQTLILALPSLSINGLDPSPSLLLPPSRPPLSEFPLSPNADDPSYEIYDTRLAQKVRALHTTLEAETTRVAELRREAPPQAAKLLAEKLMEEIRGEDENVENERRRVLGEFERRERVLEGVGLERAKDVRAMWEKGRSGLEGLRGIGEGVARLERVRGAVDGLEEV